MASSPCPPTCSPDLPKQATWPQESAELGRSRLGAFKLDLATVGIQYPRRGRTPPLLSPGNLSRPSRQTCRGCLFPQTVAQPSCRPCRHPSVLAPPHSGQRAAQEAPGPSRASPTRALLGHSAVTWLAMALGKHCERRKEKASELTARVQPHTCPPVLIQAVLVARRAGRWGWRAEAPCAPPLSATEAGGQPGGGRPAKHQAPVSCSLPTQRRGRGCGRDSTAAACKAGSASSCSRAHHVLVQLGLLAAQGPGEDGASCFSLRGPSAGPRLCLLVCWPFWAISRAGRQTRALETLLLHIMPQPRGRLYWASIPAALLVIKACSTHLKEPGPRQGDVQGRNFLKAANPRAAFWTPSHPARRRRPRRPRPHSLPSPAVPKPQPAVHVATAVKAAATRPVWEHRAQGTVRLGRHTTQADSGHGGPW